MTRVTSTSLIDSETKFVTSKATVYLTPGGNVSAIAFIALIVACDTESALAVGSCRMPKPIAVPPLKSSRVE